MAIRGEVLRCSGLDDRLAAVNWGGGVHITFQPDWQAKSRTAPSY
jgi:hypothetical protein